MSGAPTPIYPPDIRKGDSIRVEWTRSQCGSPRALEYVAPHDGTGMRKKMDVTEWATARHFLVARPSPAKREQMPTRPTLGHLAWQRGNGEVKSVLAEWSVNGFFASETYLRSNLGHDIPLRRVLSFEEVILLSVLEVDKLRRQLIEASSEGMADSVLAHIKPRRQEF